MSAGRLQRTTSMHLLFDLDGTLADSREGILHCLRLAMEENGMEMPGGDLRWCVGPPLRVAIAEILGADSAPLVEACVASYRKHYQAGGMFEVSLYPEIRETLAELRNLGHSLHVATSKAGVYARAVVDFLDLAEFFSSVTGSGLDGTLSDKTELIAAVLEHEDIPPGDAAMIGDRSHDMRGARDNGLPGIGALWGYGTGAELMDAGATMCVRVPRLLPETIAAL